MFLPTNSSKKDVAPAIPSYLSPRRTAISMYPMWLLICTILIFLLAFLGYRLHKSWGTRRRGRVALPGVELLPVANKYQDYTPLFPHFPSSPKPYTRKPFQQLTPSPMHVNFPIMSAPPSPAVFPVFPAPPRRSQSFHKRGTSEPVLREQTFHSQWARDDIALVQLSKPVFMAPSPKEVINSESTSPLSSVCSNDLVTSSPLIPLISIGSPVVKDQELIHFSPVLTPRVLKDQGPELDAEILDEENSTDPPSNLIALDSDWGLVTEHPMLPSPTPSHPALGECVLGGMTRQEVERLETDVPSAVPASESLLPLLAEEDQKEVIPSQLPILGEQEHVSDLLDLAHHSDFEDDYSLPESEIIFEQDVTSAETSISKSAGTAFALLSGPQGSAVPIAEPFFVEDESVQASPALTADCDSLSLLVIHLVTAETIEEEEAVVDIENMDSIGDRPPPFPLQIDHWLESESSPLVSISSLSADEQSEEPESDSPAADLPSPRKNELDVLVLSGHDTLHESGSNIPPEIHDIDDNHDPLIPETSAGDQVDQLGPLSTIAPKDVSPLSDLDQSNDTSVQVSLLIPDESEGASVSTRPAWSVRATEAAHLGLSADSPATSNPPSLKRVSSLPGAFQEQEETEATAVSTSVESTVSQVEQRRHRIVRSPIDIALAMQLRPGLGLGADPAWMVRFLMSMFGWLILLVSGTRNYELH